MLPIGIKCHKCNANFDDKIPVVFTESTHDNEIALQLINKNTY